MLYAYSDIRILQAEITSDCNARCPQCPRNLYGGRVTPGLPITRWRVSDLDRMFRSQFVEQLTMLYLCGTYGDPMMHPQVISIVQWFRDRNPDLRIGIHTNGGVGRIDTYRALADSVDFIGFGIDGLADTNHIYRQGVRWDNLQARVRAYIEAGGRAIWDYIVFEHNQHQVEQARTLSHLQGFKEFNVKRTARFLNRQHQQMPYQSVRNDHGAEVNRIYPPTRPEYQNNQARPLSESEIRTTPIRCNAQRIREVYVAATGQVFPCGWLHDRLYGPEVTPTTDHCIMHQWLAGAGGDLGTNCIHTPLADIVEGDWFRTIAQSHSTQSRLSRCAHMCGTQINPIGAQNQDIHYKD